MLGVEEKEGQFRNRAFLGDFQKHRKNADFSKMQKYIENSLIQVFSTLWSRKNMELHLVLGVTS
jgi:hypothetical protein